MMTGSICRSRDSISTQPRVFPTTGIRMVTRAHTSTCTSTRSTTHSSRFSHFNPDIGTGVGVGVGLHGRSDIETAKVMPDARIGECTWTQARARLL